MAGHSKMAVSYEGYGPGGVAVMVACMTTDRNRTVADVRQAFAAHGGNLGASGSVAYLFSPVGVLGFVDVADQARLLEAALDAGAEDVLARADGGVEVLADPRNLGAVRDALAGAGLVPASAGVELRPAVRVTLAESDAGPMLELLEALEDLDDVQAVHSNADIPAGVLARLRGATRQVR
jgi:YebC/PmpR family DNA-binding regulatory protein